MSEVVTTNIDWGLMPPASSSNVPDFTTLQFEGGYLGQPLISTSGGYAGVSTYNATDIPMLTLLGNWISNNIIVAGGVVILGVVLLSSRRK